MKLDDLIGRSAGEITRVTEESGGWLEPVIEAAQAIAYDQDLFMSAWTLISVLEDGATWWASPEGTETCHVTGTGEVIGGGRHAFD